MLREGVVIHERYVIRRVLGSGGMATVYLAADRVLDGKPVAVKEMDIAIHDAGDRVLALEQFKREARILAFVDHPGVVDVTDFFEDGEHAYLVMAYIDGCTLAHVVETSASTVVDELLDWADQLCDILEFLHSREPPVLVRDLKPGNIMLDCRERIRLIDFGIARALDPGRRTSTFIRGAGTEGYAPPEQYAGSTDPRTDIYALGATLYTVLTRTLPPMSVALMCGEQTLTPPRHLNSDVTPELEAVILKMMALRKEDRYASAGEARRALREIQGSFAEAPPLSTPPPSLPTTERAPSPPRRKPARGWGALILVIVGVIASAAALRYQGANPIAPVTMDLVVDSAPPGARVHLDRADRGVTPLTVASLAKGTHTLKLALDAYASQELSVAVDQDMVVASAAGTLPGTFTQDRKVGRLTVRLQALTGTLVLQIVADGVVKPGIPGGADLLVDGAALAKGQLAGTRLRLAAGPHDLRMRVAGWADWRRQVTVVSGRETPLKVALRHPTGTLRIQSTPPGARIWLDGKKRGLTPAEVEVEAGSHALRLEKGGYVTTVRNAIVRADADCPVEVKMEPLPPPPPRPEPARARVPRKDGDSGIRVD